MNENRKKKILEIMIKEKQVSVKELARRLYISEPSIRRDLAELEKSNMLRRIHGGAVLEENSASLMKIPFVIRELEQYDAKVAMARQAVELVHDGDTIMLDASSSAYNIIPFLSTKANITVITSGVKAMLALAEYRINAYSTGGHLLASCLSFTGSDAEDTISRFNADIAFFSCRGLSEDGDATDFSVEENQVRRRMLQKANTLVLLCASEKLGKKYMHTLCGTSQVDYVISEKALPEELLGRRQRT